MNVRPSIAVALMTLTVSLPGPVRAVAPPGQYVVTGTGNTATIYDTKSKLTWQRALRLGTWTEGKTICAGLGWRLPTYKELLTLLDLSQRAATGQGDKIDPVFGVAGMTGYWSATLDATNPTRAWNVNYYYGDTYPYPIANQNVIRCVR